MRRAHLRSVCGAALVAAPMVGYAQQPGSPVSGSASLGVRSVDVAGTATKFREDVNLDDGARLLDVTLSYAPAPGTGSLVDRVDLNANNLGGDPFESIHLGVRKYGAYDLKLDRRRSQYFYEDTILPAALASVTGSTGGDFHHFDFERIRDTAALDLRLSPATQLSFGLERQTRAGDSTTSLDIERDEFELERPLDESLNALTFGVRHAWQRVTVIVEEQLRDFENTSEIFLPGASPGQNTADPAQLQFFSLDQSYDYAARSHLVRVLADPTSRLNLKAAWRREDLDLDMQASERSRGTTFTGAPFSTDFTGPAEVGRDIDFSEVDLGFAISDRVQVIGGARRSTLRQSGLLMFGPDQGAGAWNIDTDGLEVGIQVAPAPNLVVAAGWSTETRDTVHSYVLNAATLAERGSTDRDGYFARLLFNTSQGLEITASIEDNSIDDPFSLASATANQRYKVSVRQRWDSGWSVTGSYRRTDVDNATSGWAADTEQTAIRLAWQREGLHVSGGYTGVDVARSIAQRVLAGTRQDLFVIGYDSDAAFVDAAARWTMNRKLTLGGELRQYDNRGSFPLARDDWRGFLDVALSTDYTLQISYRGIDYAEDAFDSYDAEILEIALRLNW